MADKVVVAITARFSIGFRQSQATRTNEFQHDRIMQSGELALRPSCVATEVGMSMKLVCITEA